MRDKIEITNSTIKKDPKPKNRIKKNKDQIWHKNKIKCWWMKLKNNFNQDKDKKITNQNQKNNDQTWYKIKCWQIKLKIKINSKPNTL